MNFKKKVSGSWTDTPHYIHNTSTDTITTLPAVIHPTGTTATVGLKGNTLQSSIPSPTSPVMPQGTGERTGNLFDINATPTKYSQSTTVTVDGRTLTITGTWYIYYEIDVVPNTDYYIKWTINYAEIKGRGSIAILTTSGQTIHNQSADPYSFNSGENQRIRLYIYAGNSISGTVRLSNIMLNTGSTVLPYEPYGIKIPILNNSQTTNVYLGEVETTRRVKKLVLTGQEDFILEATDTNRTVCRMPLIGCKGNYGFCSHINWKSSYESSEYNRLVWQTASGGTLYISLANEYLEAQTLNAFKSYLTQQYANGTPVCVWYVLATETTGIVNEPLRKIGDYADTVSGITIPTITGKDSFDVLTTLKPSEVELTYTGWHDATVEEWDGSDWQ